MDKLKPCPKCGGKVRAAYRMPYSYMRCKKCRDILLTIPDTYEQADGMRRIAEIWNNEAAELIAKHGWRADNE